MYTTPPIYDAPPIYGWIDQYLSYPGAVDLCDIASDKERWKAISKHLLSHKGLQSKNYSSYPEFLNAVANRDVTVNQQKKAIHTESTDILSHFREINELLIHSNQKRDIFPFPTDNSTVYQSFKDAVTEKIVSSWKPQEKVFLSADSTKETLDTLIQYFSAYDPNQRIVIFSGRKYRTPSEITGSDSLDKFLNSESNIMVIPYDVAVAKCRNRDQAFFFFCGQSRYLFFLDAACILNDSWDDNLNYFADLFLRNYFPNPFPNPSKIFLSNSMEEFYDFFQQINLSSKEFSPNPNTLLALPMDYTFLEPVLYENLTAICPEIQKKSAYEKWLVFVNTAVDGIRLEAQLQGNHIDACFLYEEDAAAYEELIQQQKSNCRVLIVETKLCSNLSITDPTLKNIVLPFASISSIKQMLQVKQRTPNETVRVYFEDANAEKVLDFLQESIHQSLNVMARVHAGQNAANRFFNLPACYHAYYQICFSLYLLQKMQTDPKQSYIKILLSHLSGKEPSAAVPKINAPQTFQELIEEAKVQLAAYLETLTPLALISPDENGSFDQLQTLKQKINTLHKLVYGRILDDKWKDTSRFFPEAKLNAFLSSLSLPYTIQSNSKNGVRTTIVPNIPK